LAHADALRDVRLDLARLLGAASADHIALFESGTRAWHSAVAAIAAWPRGGRVWVTPYEYAGNLLMLQALCRRHGLALEVIPVDGAGDLDLTWMAQQADERLCLVSVVHVPSACGTLLPVEAIGRWLRDACPQALYVVDACQSVGQQAIDCEAIGCDLLTAAGRKFLRGPRGTGFAAVSPRWLARVGDHPVDLHAAEVLSLHASRLVDPTARRLELTELPVAATLGLGQCVRAALAQDLAPARALYRSLCERLAARAEIRLLHPGRAHAGIVSFLHRDQSSRAVVQRLGEHAINAWVIAGAHTPLYLRAAGIESAVRLSVHCTNTPDDLDRLEAALSSFHHAGAPRLTEQAT
jgi:selenocysteine lyase/cysteine desulfurase